MLMTFLTIGSARSASPTACETSSPSLRSAITTSVQGITTKPIVKATTTPSGEVASRRQAAAARSRAPIKAR